VVSDGLSDEFGGARRAKRLHDLVLVIDRRPVIHVPDEADFLHHLAFGQQLQNFTLSIREAFIYVDQFLTPQQRESMASHDMALDT